MSDPVPSSAISDATTGGLSVIVVAGGATGDVLTKQSDGSYLPVTPASGGITGSVGSTTNRLVKSSGTGGSTVQATGVTVDSSNNVSGVGSIAITSAVSAGAVIQSWAQSGHFTGQVYSFSPVFSFGATGRCGIHAGDSAWPKLVVTTGSQVIVGDNAHSHSPGTGVALTVLASAMAQNPVEVKTYAGSAVLSVTAAGSLTIAGAWNLAPITKAALLMLTPTAASAGRWRVTDATPANREAYPDGTNWRYTSDDTVVT